MISLIIEKYQISQNLLAIYSYIKIHKLFVHHQCGKSHVKRIPKFLKVSQSKSVQNKKNAENCKNKKSLPSRTCIVLSMKKCPEGPKTPENAFSDTMGAKESISGLILQTSKTEKSRFFCTYVHILCYAMLFIYNVKYNSMLHYLKVYYMLVHML